MTESLPLREVPEVQARLAWMREAVPAHGHRVRRLNAFFDSYRSGDEYDTNAITHVMACTSRFPGRFLQPAAP